MADRAAGHRLGRVPAPIHAPAHPVHLAMPSRSYECGQLHGKVRSRIDARDADLREPLCGKLRAQSGGGLASCPGRRLVVPAFAGAIRFGCFFERGAGHLIDRFSIFPSGFTQISPRLRPRACPICPRYSQKAQRTATGQLAQLTPPG